MKKLIALTLTMALLISCLSNVFSAFAVSAGNWFEGSVAEIPADAPFSISDNVISVKEGDNILKDKPVEILCFNSGGENSYYFSGENAIANGSGSSINDADADNNVDYNSNGNAAELLFHLQGEVTPKAFVMIGRAWNALQFKEYEIYGGNSYSEVRYSTTPIAKYTRAISDDADGRVNIYTFESGLSFKYFRIKFISELRADGIMRFNEVMLLGDYVQDTDAYADEESDILTNVPTADKLTPVEKSLSPNGGTTTKIEDERAAKLDDGDLTTQIDFSEVRFYDGTNYINDGTNYLDIIYDLGGNYSISDALVVSTPNMNNRTNAYKIYASENEKDLFTGDAVYTYNSNSKTQKQHIRFVPDEVSARFVAIRITDPSIVDQNGWYDWVRLCEFSVFGAKAVSKPKWIYKGSAAGVTADLPIAIANDTITYDAEKTNLLAVGTAEALSYNASGYEYGTDQSMVAKLVDGSTYHTNAYDYPGFGSTEIIFQLDAEVLPEYFVMVNRAEGILQTYDYEIYGASSYVDIRNNPTLIASYKRTDSAANDEQVNVFYFGDNAATIKYFKIKVNQANYSHSTNWIRICETALIGTVVAAEDKIVYEKDVPTVLTENYIQAVSKAYSVNCGSDVAIDSNNMDDGDVNTEEGLYNALFATEDADGNVQYLTNRTAEITYDLGAVYDLSNVQLINHSNTFLRTNKYAIFVSNDRATLYNAENKVADFVNEAVSREQLWDLGSKNATGKFVGIQIYDATIGHGEGATANWSSVFPRITEFRVYGTVSTVYHNVTFMDRSGNEVHKIQVANGSTILSDELDAAIAKLPSIYGYDKLGEWDNDVTAPITGDTSFTALYSRKSETYSVAYTKVNGQRITMGDLQFDVRITLRDDEAIVWMLNNSVIAEGTVATAYVCGDMELTASDVSPAESTMVSIVAADVDNVEGNLTVFAHVYNADANVMVKSYGIIFVSGTTYDQIKNQEDWSEDTLNQNTTLKHARTKIVGKTANNFMSTLTNIPTSKVVRRVARAYAVIDNNGVESTIYSDAYVATFGE